MNRAIEEWQNVVPTTTLEEALAWSVRDHAESIGQPFVDLSDDGEVGHNGTVDADGDDEDWKDHNVVQYL